MRRIPGLWMVALGGATVGAFLLAALAAPFLSPSDPTEIELQEALLSPSLKHPLGTDQLGRDVFSRMLYGTRVSLKVGFMAVGLSLLVGISLGAIAGYWGGWVDMVLMRFVDIMLCFPTFFLLLAAIAFLGPNLMILMAIIGLTSWMGVARLIRAEFLSLREREFILAARGIGASPARIIFRHLIPNATAPILVNATLGIASAILTETALSFLGIGVQPPIPSWGNILSEGKATLGIAWWLTFFPGMAIFFTVLGSTLTAEGLKKMLRR